MLQKCNNHGRSVPHETKQLSMTEKCFAASLVSDVDTSSET